jgi:hypothetical protein
MRNGLILQDYSMEKDVLRLLVANESGAVNQCFLSIGKPSEIVTEKEIKRRLRIVDEIRKVPGRRAYKSRSVEVSCL